MGDQIVWLHGVYRRREFYTDRAFASGMIWRWFNDDAPVHLIPQRSHNPYVCCEVFEVHASLVLTGMMILVRRVGAVAVFPQPEIAGNLVGGQEGAHFEVGGQMHRAQATLQFAD
jgi:hypothetical protein